MAEQIRDLAELAGKTVERAVELHGWNTIGIVFKDGSFLYIGASGWRDEPPWPKINATATIEECAALGFVSDEELARHQEGREAARERDREAREREDLARLKAKYGG
jgi:hypothetical protein